MIVLLNICMAVLFFNLGALALVIRDSIDEALEKKRAAKKALEAKIEKLEKLVKSNLDKKED